MMTISEKLIEINDVKESLKLAVNNAGGNISDEDSFNSYSTKISNTVVPISSGALEQEKFPSILEKTSTPTFSILDGELCGVTNIAYKAFQYCYGLTSIVQQSVLTFEADCFKNCINLVTADFPNAVTGGNNLFYSCSSLEAVSLPKLETIGSYTFLGCSKLTDLYLPSILSINKYAFSLANNLVTITVGTNIDDESKALAPWGATNATIIYE